MADTATLAPSPAVPAPAPQMPSQVRPPTPTPEIKASEFYSGSTAPPKPGSARERMYKDLRKKAGMLEEPTPATPPPASEPEPQAPASPEPAQEPAPEPGSPSPEPTPAPETTDKKKVSPWKLVEQYKSRLSDLEKEVASYKTNGLSQEKLDGLTQSLQQSEARAKALEDEMRFVNYSKSQEFVDQYQKPYEAAWTRAMSELKELTIEDPGTQQRRQVVVDDLLQLVNLPLGQAREIADQLFGKFADDVMAHRKEIKNLFDKQSTALEEAKKNGAAREKQRQEQWKNATTQISTAVVEQWKKFNQALATDTKFGRFFQPVEGDLEGNQRLAKGFELVDRAFGENPNDPRLNAEQRASIIKRHAAVRNRAAAFGRLASQNESLAKEIDALKKELGELKRSEPPTTGTTRTSTTNGAPTSARDEVMASLRKLAR